MGYYCELYCLVNEIAIGRPAMFTCPVKTIMIFFTLINQSPPDYSNYHDINSVKTLNEKFEG